jgi:hypothetical protein
VRYHMWDLAKIPGYAPAFGVEPVSYWKDGGLAATRTPDLYRVKVVRSITYKHCY